MKKILVLGHKGMLGNAVYSYLEKTKKYTLLTTNERFGAPEFKEDLENSEADTIINCIGCIPQKKYPTPEYKKVNIELPIFLETLGKKILHPSTDCEFSGKLMYPLLYKKNAHRDAEDDYGKSKAYISELIEQSFKNTKIIRTSIIGHELKSSLSFLDWFLFSENEVRGYTNHYWNGITTLQWAQLAESYIDNWETYPRLGQYGTTDSLSKYEVLKIIQTVYNKDIKIEPYNTPVTINKSLASDTPLPSIKSQLQDLKLFYKR